MLNKGPPVHFQKEGGTSDTPLFQVLVTYAVFRDGPGKNAKEEVSRKIIQRRIIFLKGTKPRNFFRPPSPLGGRKEAVVLIVVKR